jgi:hypothetical protein
MPLGSE